MTGWDMARVALFPHLSADGGAMGSMPMESMPMDSGVMAWSLSAWLVILAMWWVMMIAMMVPSAAPTILLYNTVYRNSHARDGAALAASSGAFVLGYLSIWLGFSMLATVLQWLFTRAGILAGMTMSSTSAYLSAAVLLAAGLYQFTPFKDMCLRQCRDPAGFLSRHWRPGPTGALRLGAIHGAYCLGCCWLLMALLFVGGVMNPIWIAALAVLVLAEKLLPGGRWIGLATGLVLCLWAGASLVV
jgi:predicted metal-binding membrane protein